MTEIRSARPSDIDAMARLFNEIDKFYGDPPKGASQHARQVKDALFANPPSAYAMLAWDEDKLTGLAAYSYVWPASGTSRSVYLKELYVTQPARRNGVGALLMRELFRHARNNGCTRVEWTTDASNVEAKAFYAALGVKLEKSKLFFRVADDELYGLAAPVEGLRSRDRAAPNASENGPRVRRTAPGSLL